MIVLFFDLDRLRPLHLQKSLCQIVLNSSKQLQRQCMAVGDLEDQVSFKQKFDHVYSSRFFMFRFVYLLRSLLKFPADVLLLHLTRKTMLIALIINKWSPRSKIVIKMDADPLLFEYEPKFISRVLMNFTAKNVHRVIIETEHMAERLKAWGYFPVDDNSIVIINNAAADCKIGPVVEKQQQIVVISRFGAVQKNTPLLFALINNSNQLSKFKIKLFGPVEKNYEIEFQRFLKQNPSVIWEGEVADPTELGYQLAKSKALLHTARYEGFATVFNEAIVNGCYIISTPVNGYLECTNRGQFGFELCTSVSSVTVEKLDHFLLELFHRADFQEPRLFGLSNYTWEYTLTSEKVDMLWCD